MQDGAGFRPLKQSALSADNLCANNPSPSNRPLLDKQCLRSCLHLVFALLSDTQRQLRFQVPPETRSDASSCPSTPHIGPAIVHTFLFCSRCTMHHCRKNFVEKDPCSVCRSPGGAQTRTFGLSWTTPQNSAGPVRRCRGRQNGNRGQWSPCRRVGTV
jgi:hypothetical protein